MAARTVSVLLTLATVLGGIGGALFVHAQDAQVGEGAGVISTSSASLLYGPVRPAATTSPEDASGLLGTLAAPKQDLTKPEQDLQKTEIQQLLERRPVREPSVLQFFAYWVQHAITLGIPANTIVLILLLPVIATIVAFVRVVVGLPTLEMLVPVALAYAFVAVGVVVGLIILASVVAATFLSRFGLRRARLMHFPKRSLSLLLLALAVFFALSLGVSAGLTTIQELSIFPILILALLGDAIVSIQLHKSLSDTITITSITILVGLIGFMLATAGVVRDVIILYPEVVLLTIPINLMMGRYFGLRLFELIRFNALRHHGTQ